MPFIECSTPHVKIDNPRIDAAAQGKLLPTIVDELARDEPNGLWIEYPTSPTSLDAGFNQITYAELANAVNGVANCITSALGRANTGESLAWLAPNSPLCSITLIAAMKAGFKVCKSWTCIYSRTLVADHREL
jgi:acyl-CoA synthetase (AMP-forming)/AMP-acid ligase II